MSQRNDRLKDPGTVSPELILVASLIGTVVFAGFVLWVAATLGNWITGTPLRSNYSARIVGVFTGDTAFPLMSWIVLVVLVIAVIAGSILVLRAWLRAQKKKTRIDPASHHMATMRELGSLSPQGAQATAERLGVMGSPGVPIAKHQATGTPLYGSWEDVHVDVWGPRQGKSSCRVIPAIVAAPGPVLTTSNKRDVVDATREVRAERGRVWVFDPQRVADESPNEWFWDPLSYVEDEEKAQSLAQHFANSSREVGSKPDAYFDPAGENLVADYLLAAKLGGYPITQVYRWITLPTEREAVTILREHGFPLQADRLASIIGLTEKQRDGVFGTAQKMISFLTSTKIKRWVCADGPDDGREQFDPHQFARSTDTLYSLSMEGVGSAGPVVTALTVAVVEAATDYAKKCRGGRLPVPMVVPLDEAANVCRWKQLPDLYSHLGSRGIIPMTFMQSWSQGVEVWGERGMAKLWSAANVRVYGGNVDEKNFLEDRSTMIGEHDRIRISTSGNGSVSSSRNVSRQVQRERTLTASDLAALPKGRAIVFSAGNRAALVRTTHWKEGPFAEAINNSIRIHDPQGEATLKANDVELARVDAALDFLEDA